MTIGQEWVGNCSDGTFALLSLSRKTGATQEPIVYQPCTISCNNACYNKYSSKNSVVAQGEQRIFG